MPPKKYSYFIGIDVSKNKLDYDVSKNGELLFHQERENSEEAVRLFVKELREMPGFSIPKTVFCMEAIGLYANHLLAVLQKNEGCYCG